MAAELNHADEASAASSTSPVSIDGSISRRVPGGVNAARHPVRSAASVSMSNSGRTPPYRAHGPLRCQRRVGVVRREAATGRRRTTLSSDGRLGRSSNNGSADVGSAHVRAEARRRGRAGDRGDVRERRRRGDRGAAGARGLGDHPALDPGGRPRHRRPRRWSAPRGRVRTRRPARGRASERRSCRRPAAGDPVPPGRRARLRGPRRRHAAGRGRRRVRARVHRRGRGGGHRRHRCRVGRPGRLRDRRRRVRQARRGGHHRRDRPG